MASRAFSFREAPLLVRRAVEPRLLAATHAALCFSECQKGHSCAREVLGSEHERLYTRFRRLVV